MTKITPEAVEAIPLAECPEGLFWYGETLCLKTEYGNNKGRIDAYIVGSGEFFWGDQPKTIENQRAQMVRPIDTDFAERALSAQLEAAPQPASGENEAVDMIIRATGGRCWHEDAGAVEALHLAFRAGLASATPTEKPLDANTIEACASYLDGYAGGHYMAQSCAAAIRSLSAAPAVGEGK